MVSGFASPKALIYFGRREKMSFYDPKSSSIVAFLEYQPFVVGSYVPPKYE